MRKEKKNSQNDFYWQPFLHLHKKCAYNTFFLFFFCFLQTKDTHCDFKSQIKQKQQIKTVCVHTGGSSASIKPILISTLWY